MNKPSLNFSVICYNNKQELLLTLRSVMKIALNQKSYVLSLSVIDGSDHALLSDAFLSEFDKFISTIYINELDDGPYDAMNKAISLLASKWCIFLNSGDEIMSIPNFLDESKSLVIGSWSVDNINYHLPSLQTGLSHTSRREIGCGLCHQAMIFRSSAIKNKKYSHKYKLAAELDFFIPFLLENDYCIATDLCIVYDNQNGLSQRKALKHLLESLIIYRAYGLPIGPLRVVHRLASALKNASLYWINRLLFIK